MIVGALVVRGRLDDRQEEAGQVYRLVCSSDLGPVCDDLQTALPGRVDMTIEPAGTTADRLRRLDGDPGLDGWLVLDPWSALVDEARRAASLPPLFAAGRPPLARSPLVIVGWKDRAEALGPTCAVPGSIGWKCLGEAAGQPWKDRRGQEVWGDVKVGHADPAADGTGLLVLGQATVDFFDGRTDLSTFDLEDDGYQRWLLGLERPMTPSPRSPLDRMLQIGRAAYDFVGTTEAEAAKVDGAASRAALTKIYPSSMASADVVLALTPGGRGDRLRAIVDERARDGLTDSGWKEPGAAGLAPANGLPSPGLLDALRAKAREVTGR